VHEVAATVKAKRERAPRGGSSAVGAGDGPAATVSVIVPCFNYGHLLEGCVTSVLAQQGVDVRVLIIDDCSPDHTPEVGRGLAESDGRVEFRRHPSNMGLIATANEGLEWAQAEYVVLLSADDLLIPGCLRRATAVMAAHPNVGLVYGRPLIANEGRPIPTPSGRWRATDVWSGEDWIRMRCRSGHNCMSSPEVVVRNDVQRAVGGYDPACYHTSDLNLWLRIAAVADIAYVRGVAQAIYRVHSASMLRSQDGPLTYLRERRAAFDSFFSACSSQLDEPERLRSTVGRTLARQALWRASRAVDLGGTQEEVDSYVDFALDVFPDARRLREWRGLALRRRIGFGRSLIFVPFIATSAAHRLHYHASQARWRLRGV
jgi:GT2 family glycosyltransferase